MRGRSRNVWTISGGNSGSDATPSRPIRRRGVGEWEGGAGEMNEAREQGFGQVLGKGGSEGRGKEEVR